MPQDLEEVVAAATTQAATDLDGKLAPTPLVEGEEPLSPVETTPVVKLPTAEELDDLGLTKAQQLDARRLFASLQDPAKAPTVIEFLARNAGFTKAAPPETKKEIEVAAKGMVEELTEALGPELAYLAEKMGPVFEKHLKNQAEELVKPLRGRLEERELSEFRNEGDRVQNVLAKRFFGADALPDPVVAKMVETMNHYNASNGQTMEDYMENVLFISAGKLGLQLKAGAPPQKPNQERATRSRENAPANLENRAKPALGEVSTHPSRQLPLSLEDSIYRGMEQAKAELTK